jgi:hypothetical protein
MSQTLRFFVNDKRVSTAVNTKKGFLQVYPDKRTFASEEEWKETWRIAVQPVIKVEADKKKAVEKPSKTLPNTKKPAVSKKKKPAYSLPPPVEPIATHNWTYRNTRHFTAPPGKYYIGDICYALGDKVYDRVFGAKEYDSGLYTQKDTGNFFLVDGTAHGDGLYMDSDGKEYGVDAGVIGIVSAALVEKDCRDGGHMHTFTEPVECRFKHGIFHFESASKHLIIDTYGHDDEDEYDDDDY